MQADTLGITFLCEIICFKKELLSGLAIGFIMKEIFDKFI